MPKDLRVVCMVEEYDGAVAFFRDGLELPVTGGWDLGPDNRGTLFGAASGTIEVLNQRGETVVDEIRGVRIAIEVDDVDASYRAAKQKGLTITLKPTTESWGAHRCWIEGPSGIRVALFTRTS